MEAPEDRVPCEDFATCGVAQFQNRQYLKNKKQQDSYFVVEDIGAIYGVNFGQVHKLALFGVADGHGEYGEIAANFIRRNLPPQLAQSPHFAAGQLIEAFLEAFTQTELLQQSAGLPLYASGACVTAAAVTPTHIVVANCGDCRAVLCDHGAARNLSNDHNVEHATPEEIQRVLSRGGSITPDKRVTMAGAPGRLSTTRSLGDYWAKPQGPPENHVISGLPEIRAIPRQPGQQYLILASDGIFGFMSSQDVVTLCLTAASQVAPSSPLSRLAHTVLCTAVNSKRSDDNCTCLIVDLRRVDDRSIPPQLYDHSPCPPLMAGPGQGQGQGQGQGHCQVGHGQCQVSGQAPGRGPGGLGPGGPVPGMGPGMLGLDGPAVEHGVSGGSPNGSEGSLSSLVAPDEVCWCQWCWRQSRDGEPENVVLGSFERWRQHMHEQHFDKLGFETYLADEIVPCYWCCRPCVTKKGQGRANNRLPFWGSHERVCRENPNKSAVPLEEGSDRCQPLKSPSLKGFDSLSAAGSKRSPPRSPPRTPPRRAPSGRRAL